MRTTAPTTPGATSPPAPRSTPGTPSNQESAARRAQARLLPRPLPLPATVRRRGAHPAVRRG